QRRVAARGLGDVVEADDGQVARDVEPQVPRDLHRGERREVVRREDRGRTVGEREQLAGGAARRLDPVVAGAHERRVYRDACGGERLAVALLAETRRLEVVTAAEEGDAPVTEPDE